ncbi:MAG: SDR family NAD(P)-dependent oxidoreductase [Acidobacteriota bacterium]
MTSACRYPDLEGKRVLVTGASSGIGLACAEAFLRQGARVVLHFRNGREAAERAAAAYPGLAFTAGADLAAEVGCVALVAEAVRLLGGLDVLVHSAGIWTPGPIRELSRETLETLFRTNTFSSYYLARECARVMEGGSLVFIGSTAGQRGEPNHSHYAGSKGAIQSMVMSLAQELAPAIRVNLVSPGWVRTPMSEEALRTREAAIVSVVPLRRVAEAEDVAAAALFLASEASRHFTGADLCCSGGALLPMPRG